MKIVNKAKKNILHWESEYGNGGPAIDETLLKSIGDKYIDLFFEFF